MDTFEPFQTFQFNIFTFCIKNYKGYNRGQLLSNGYIDISIFCKTQENNIIKTYLINNSPSDKILSKYDPLFILEDRMQLTISPKNTNIEDVLFPYFKWTIHYAQEHKQLAKNKPIL